ncbi:hypothetical protein [Streptomyces sp. NPDC014894]|uniref:hypothetical protein n=1 Tax=unclassified Streptomyces TaxID=2593676 RepID=UPI0036F7FE17
MTIRARFMALALGIAAVGALTTATAVPAQAAAPAAPAVAEQSAQPAAWYPTTSKGGPIRECYRASCRVIVDTYNGEAMHWSHYAVNPSGNRWYYVRDSVGYTGWIYCGNITAGC